MTDGDGEAEDEVEWLEEVRTALRTAADGSAASFWHVDDLVKKHVYALWVAAERRGVHGVGEALVRAGAEFVVVNPGVDMFAHEAKAAPRVGRMWHRFVVCGTLTVVNDRGSVTKCTVRRRETLEERLGEAWTVVAGEFAPGTAVGTEAVDARDVAAYLAFPAEAEDPLAFVLEASTNRNLRRAFGAMTTALGPFTTWSVDEIAELLPHSSLVDVAPRTLLRKQGEATDSFDVLIKGTVRVTTSHTMISSKNRWSSSMSMSIPSSTRPNNNTAGSTSSSSSSSNSSSRPNSASSSSSTKTTKSCYKVNVAMLHGLDLIDAYEADGLLVKTALRQSSSTTAAAIPVVCDSTAVTEALVLHIPVARLIPVARANAMCREGLSNLARSRKYWAALSLNLATVVADPAAIKASAEEYRCPRVVVDPSPWNGDADAAAASDLAALGDPIAGDAFLRDRIIASAAAATSTTRPVSSGGDAEDVRSYQGEDATSMQHARPRYNSRSLRRASVNASAASLASGGSRRSTSVSAPTTTTTTTTTTTSLLTSDLPSRRPRHSRPSGSAGSRRRRLVVNATPKTSRPASFANHRRRHDSAESSSNTSSARSSMGDSTGRATPRRPSSATATAATGRPRQTSIHNIRKPSILSGDEVCDNRRGGPAVDDDDDDDRSEVIHCRIVLNADLAAAAARRFEKMAATPRSGTSAPSPPSYSKQPALLSPALRRRLMKVKATADADRSRTVLSKLKTLDAALRLLDDDDNYNNIEENPPKDRWSSLWPQAGSITPLALKVK